MVWASTFNAEGRGFDFCVSTFPDFFFCPGTCCGESIYVVGYRLCVSYWSGLPCVQPLTGFMRQNIIIFATLKNNSLEIKNLLYSYRKILQNGVKALPKMIFKY